MNITYICFIYLFICIIIFYASTRVVKKLIDSNRVLALFKLLGTALVDDRIVMYGRFAVFKNDRY